MRLDAQKKGAGERATIGAHPPARGGRVDAIREWSAQLARFPAYMSCVSSWRAVSRHPRYYGSLRKTDAARGALIRVTRAGRGAAPCGRNAASCRMNCTTQSQRRRGARESAAGSGVRSAPRRALHRSFADLRVRHTGATAHLRATLSRCRAGAGSRPRGGGCGARSPPAGRRARTAHRRRGRGRCVRPPGRPTAR